MIDTTNNTIHTANAILYKIENGEHKFLIVQENDGNWGLPGGAKDVEDPDLFATLTRELKEELNLEPDDYDAKNTGITHEFEYSHFQSSRFGKIGIVHFFLVALKSSAKIKSSNELSSVKWFSKNDVARRLTFDFMKSKFREISHALTAEKN